MIEATRIEQPEVERPDLYVGLILDAGRYLPNGRAFASAEDAASNDDYPVREVFRLPGTRREKLTKEREKLIADVVAAVRAWDANEAIAGTTVINAARRLADFDSALLALDAEGVKG